MNLKEIFEKYRVFYEGGLNPLLTTLSHIGYGQSLLTIGQSLDLEVADNIEILTFNEGRFTLQIQGRNYDFSAYRPAW